MSYTCPVCEYSGMPFPPERHEICPSCGTEFGYDDHTKSHRQLRREWLSRGAPWFSQGGPPPGWTPLPQLAADALPPRPTDPVLETYLAAYRDLISVERSGDSVVLSIPLHLAAGHRVEVTVTDLGDGHYILSDSARAIGELDAAGFSLTKRLKERVEQVAGVSGLSVVNDHLTLECDHPDLGRSIQKFIEVVKTIGDAYLRWRSSAPAPEEK